MDIKICMCLLSSAYSKLHIGGHLKFQYFPELGFLGTFYMFFETIFLVDPAKISLLRIYPTL